MVEGPRTASSRPSHLYAADVVRLVTVAAVIAVHSIANAMNSDALWPGLVTILLHVTREVFLFLSAFVLAYSYRDRALRPRPFWRKRYPLVVVPYVVWTMVYVGVNDLHGSLGGVAATLLRDLATGKAEYHLYFLVVTLQLYAVFPWLLRAARRWQHRAVAVVVASGLLEVALTAAMHYHLPVPALIEAWFHNAGPLLPSYQLYIVSGIFCALNYEAITTWVRDHQPQIAFFVVGAFGLGIASYFHDVNALSMRPVEASEVFQPVVVIESAAAVVGQYALGLWIADRIGARGRRRLQASSDVSFGVYLLHPLLLAALVLIDRHSPVGTAMSSLPVGVKLIVILGGLVPFLYAVAAVCTAALRRTPLSLAVTGRPSSAGLRTRADTRVHFETMGAHA